MLKCTRMCFYFSCRPKVKKYVLCRTKKLYGKGFTILQVQSFYNSLYYAVVYLKGRNFSIGKNAFTMLPSLLLTPPVGYCKWHRDGCNKINPLLGGLKVFPGNVWNDRFAKTKQGSTFEKRQRRHRLKNKCNVRLVCYKQEADPLMSKLIRRRLLNPTTTYVNIDFSWFRSLSTPYSLFFFCWLLLAKAPIESALIQCCKTIKQKLAQAFWGWSNLSLIQCS